MRIKNQTVLVTGAASGLGRATAEALAQGGAKVICLDLKEDETHAVAKELGGVPCVCDISNNDDLAQAFSKAIEQAGVPRIISNCAGVSIPAKMFDRDGNMTTDVFERSVRINLVGTYNVMSHAIKAMRTVDPLEDNERGVIINTASIACEDGQIGQVAYAASKGGVAAMTLPAARELARDGIRVLCLSPGLFETPLMNVLPESARESLNDLTLFPKRLGKPSEYARVVCHIAENVILNGEHIRLDGGIRLPVK